ncbi:MAG: murein transglycosylase A [Betaproteobacteria bacterium]
MTTVPPSPPGAQPDAVAVDFTEAAFASIPGWDNDALAEAWPAFQASCKALVARAASRDAWGDACAASGDIDGRDATSVRTFFEARFRAYRMRSRDPSALQSEGLVTGYYEPLLHGSRTRDQRYRYPIYARPADLLVVELSDIYRELKDKRVRGRMDGNRVVPYWTRAEIDAGRGPPTGSELLYVDDPLEAFFLQVQGSGRIALADGSTMRVGYADQNGHPYRAIGRVLVERGELTVDQASMQGIKQWGREHPDALPALLAENPSYVFFRESESPARAATLGDAATVTEGPHGALGVALTAGRSVAVDARFVPLGAPVFVATTWPQSARALRRLMLAQDTGGAIRGPLRVDWFWGFGEDAAREAGRMKQDGQLWLLWPKGAPLPQPR